MNESTAKENIRACVALCGGCDKDTESGPCHAEEKAFLGGLAQGREEAKGLVELLELGLSQMKKINGGEEKCTYVLNIWDCPNHSWINKTERFFQAYRESEGKEGV